MWGLWSLTRAAALRRKRRRGRGDELFGERAGGAAEAAKRQQRRVPRNGARRIGEGLRVCIFPLDEFALQAARTQRACILAACMRATLMA